MPGVWRANADANAGLSSSSCSRFVAHQTLAQSRWCHAAVPGAGSPAGPTQSIGSGAAPPASAGVTATANDTAQAKATAVLRNTSPPLGQRQLLSSSRTARLLLPSRPVRSLDQPPI